MAGESEETCPIYTWQEALEGPFNLSKKPLYYSQEGGLETVGLSADSLQLQPDLSNSNCFLNQ